MIRQFAREEIVRDLRGRKSQKEGTDHHRRRRDRTCHKMRSSGIDLIMAYNTGRSAWTGIHHNVSGI